MKHTMMHGFDVEIATKYGIEEAVIIHNFQFWLNKNYAEGINRFDDKTWTYNTTASLAKLFPYMTARAVRYAVDSLVNKGVLIKGNYNKAGYDRTVWYAFCDERTWLYTASDDLTKTANGNAENVVSDLTKTANGNAENVQPIPDSKHKIVNKDCKQQIQGSEKVTKKSDDLFDDFYAVYPKKEGRSVAKKVWVKIPASLHQEIIEDVVNRKANHEGWRDKRYIPQPSAYLNQERWTDEIRPLSSSNNQLGNGSQPPSFSKPKRWGDSGNSDAIDSTVTPVNAFQLGKSL